MSIMSELDGFDYKILAQLQLDGRLTNQEVGDQIGLSASQCSRRRSRLEEMGIIEGYSARINRDALGFDLICMISVTLATHNRNNATRIEALFNRLPNVLEAHTMTGSTDYMIKVVMKDLKALSEFINEDLLPHEAVQNVQSSVVLKTLKATTALPILD
jgi:DNA-binding Lrp family transcriptional regulator